MKACTLVAIGSALWIVTHFAYVTFVGFSSSPISHFGRQRTLAAAVPMHDVHIDHPVSSTLRTVVPVPPLTLPATHETLSFIVIGDWGGPGRTPQRDVALAMHSAAMSHRNGSTTPLDFIVSTGDNIYEDGAANDHDKRFNRNFERVYVHSTQQCRWYMVLGNHDHGAHGVLRDVRAEVNYTLRSKRWFLPAPYYSQVIRFGGSCADNTGGRITNTECSVEMFFLDTYEVSPRLTKMSKTQLDWLASSLSRSTAVWRMVIGHRPVYSAGKLHGSSPYMQKHLLPLFRKHRVAAYLCGDDHELQVLRDDSKVAFVVSGGGARATNDLRPKGVKQTVFQLAAHGFFYGFLNATTLAFEVIDRHGALRYAFSVPRIIDDE